jgi:nucleoid-associated protein YgaU
MAGCQAQSKAPASGTTPTVLNVAGPQTPHRPSVYAMPSNPTMRPAMPAAYAATAAESRAAVPAYLPPDGSAALAVPVLVEQPVSPPSAAPALKLMRKAEGKTYLVKQGDTLFRIAKEHYGSGVKWRQIAAANPGLTPATLKAGQKLLMP